MQTRYQLRHSPAAHRGRHTTARRWNAASIPVPSACVVLERRRPPGRQAASPPVRQVAPYPDTHEYRPAPGHPHGQAARSLAGPDLPRHPRPVERDHRRPRCRGRLRDADPGRQSKDRRHGDPPPRQRQPRRPGGCRVPLAERQRRNDRRLLDRGVRHLRGPGRDHQHALGRDRARRHHQLDEPVSPGVHRGVAAAGRRRDLGRLPQRHQRSPRHRGDRDRRA